MPDSVIPLARVRLERSLPRLLAAPLFLLLAGAAAIGAGFVVGGVVAIGLGALGAVVTLAGIVGTVVLLSVRLEVDDALIRIRWLGGERRYPLARGAVTRVAVRGPGSSTLESRLGALGWALGTATLRGEETIEVVRLAATRTVILVPTERGRLAIAPHSEGELLDALTRAAEARQRLDELSRAAPPIEEVEPEIPEEAPGEAPADELDGADASGYTTLTGIERAELEERLAAERALAERRLKADVPTATAAAVGDASASGAPVAAEAAIAPPVATPAERGARRVRMPRWLRPSVPPALGASVAFVALPMLAAGGVWGVGDLLGRLPAAGTDELRQVTLTLVLGGPATSIGALMARVWWPRLIGVVVTSGLAALLIAARAVFGT